MPNHLADLKMNLYLAGAGGALPARWIVPTIKYGGEEIMI